MIAAVARTEADARTGVVDRLVHLHAARRPMLTPEQVLPFLNHDERIVRGRALRYFKGGHDIGPLTAEHFWEVIDRFGVGKETLRFFAELAEVPQTERSYQRLMQALRSGQEEL